MYVCMVHIYKTNKIAMTFVSEIRKQIGEYSYIYERDAMSAL